jgi:tRNA(Ile)-lysidine synthase
MKNERHALEAALAEAWPPASWEDFTLLVAVSGGADSVAILRALAALKIGGTGRLIVAHFQHGLRAAADEEARFVRALAEQLGLSTTLGAGDPAAIRAHPDGVEAGARAQRYAFLRETAERIAARYVVTGHTADDQAETIIHRIVRGTAVAGLAGIHRTRQMSEAVTLVRPMLAIRRREILDYLAALGQSFCNDASNLDPAYIRNKIRHELLPYLAGYNHDVAGALVRLGAAAKDSNQIIESLVEGLVERCVKCPTPQRAIIDCDKLAGQHRHLIRELFVAIWRTQAWPQQAMTFAHWDRLAELAVGPHPEGAKHSLPGSILAARIGAKFELKRDGGS